MYDRIEIAVRRYVKDKQLSTSIVLSLSIYCFLSFFFLGVGDDLVRTLRYVHLKCISFAAVEVRRLLISILHCIT